jgi:hypothetical protein
VLQSGGAVTQVFGIKFEGSGFESYSIKISLNGFLVIVYRPAMGNLRPLKLYTAVLLKPQKYRYFIEKSTKSEVKVYILALDMTIYQKIGPRADSGCPWLV